MIITSEGILSVYIPFMLLSSILISFLFTLYEDTNWIYIKDGSVIFLILTGFILRAPYVKSRYLVQLLPLFMIVMYSFAISPADMFSKIASLRQIYIPFAIVYIGMLYGTGIRDNARRLKTQFLIIMSVLILFGFLERFFYLWTEIDLSSYFLFKNIPVASSGYPSFFIEPISIPGLVKIDGGIPRMVSTLLDPINWGHTLVFTITMLLYDKGIKLNYYAKRVLLAAAIVALGLSFSKGAFLQLFLISVFLNPSIGYKYRLMLIFFFFLPSVYLFSLYHAGFWVHLHGLLGSIVSLTWLGHGLGMVGNYSAMFNAVGISAEMSIGDSYWGAVIGQIGAIGFIVWLLAFYLMTKGLMFNDYIFRAFVALILVSALSENSFNLMSVFVTGIFLGVVITNKYQLKQGWFEYLGTREKNLI